MQELNKNISKLFTFKVTSNMNNWATTIASLCQIPLSQVYEQCLLNYRFPYYILSNQTTIQYLMKLQQLRSTYLHQSLLRVKHGYKLLKLITQQSNLPLQKILKFYQTQLHELQNHIQYENKYQSKIWHQLGFRIYRKRTYAYVKRYYKKLIKFHILPTIPKKKFRKNIKLKLSLPIYTCLNDIAKEYHITFTQLFLLSFMNNNHIPKIIIPTNEIKRIKKNTPNYTEIITTYTSFKHIKKHLVSLTKQDTQIFNNIKNEYQKLISILNKQR